MKRFLHIGLAILVCVSAVWAQNLPPRRYPSIRLGLVLPGSYVNPTDQWAIELLTSLYGAAGAAEVSRFEAEHFDFSFGSGIMAPYRDRVPTIDYVYFQHLYTSPASGDLREFVEEVKGWNWEDMFLHFKQDTYIDAKEVTTTETIWAGKPTITLYQTSSNSWMNNWSASVDALAYSNSGGGLVIAAAEPVAEINIVSLSRNGDPGTNGQIVIEYTNARRQSDAGVAGWGTAVITYDGTNGLRQPGVIRFAPPADWKWVVCTNSSYAYKGRVFLIRLRTPGYTVFPQIQSFRLRQVITVETTGYRTGSVISATANSVTINNRSSGRTTNYYRDMQIEIIAGRGAGQVRMITGSSYGGNPRLDIAPNWDVVPDNTSVYRITGPTVKVPGWDPANDRNGDGYVDDVEFGNLVNPLATARFKWESRATKGTEQWSSSSAPCFANLWNPQYGQALREYHIPRWAASGIRGYYNDDAISLMEYPLLPVVEGGYIWEYPGGRAGVDSDVVTAYRDAYISLHQSFRNAGVEWVAGNIAPANLWMSSYGAPFTQAFNFLLLEDMVWDTLGYLDNYGIMRRGWGVAGYVKHGIHCLVMGQKNRNGGVIDDWGNTRGAWEYATMAQLAQYYLLNVPDRTLFNFWSKSMTYGSGLTSTTSLPFLFWRGGVPVNMAYPPFDVVRVDIGVPTNRIPGGYQPMHYVQVGSYTVVGDTTQTTLTNVPGSPNGTLEVIPTYVFYLWRSVSNVVGNIPEEAVLAREYTKGLVLYRARAFTPTSSAGRVSYMAPENAMTVQLPGLYRRVNYDGTLGPPVTEISIRGFEGIVLVKASESSQPDVQLTISVDKANPKPLDVVTVTITAANAGNADARNVRITHDIPQGATYVRGSLKLNGNALPDPTDTTKIDVTVTSIPVGGQAVVEFQMVIR
jgi:uncharacterized repeat protein (TIGR01451 family)